MTSAEILIHAKAQIINPDEWFGRGSSLRGDYCGVRHCAATALLAVPGIEYYGHQAAREILNDAALGLYGDHVITGDSGGGMRFPEGSTIRQCGHSAHIAVNNYIGHQAVLRVYDEAILHAVLTSHGYTQVTENDLATAGD